MYRTKETDRAGVCWSWEDVKSQDLEDEWTEQECQELLDDIEVEIQEAMIIAGWDIIKEFMRYKKEKKNADSLPK